MKKIYIVTFHCAMNVGAVLQCYALSSYLKSKYKTVQVVDYRDRNVICESIESELNLKKESLVYYRLRAFRIFLGKIKRFIIGRACKFDFYCTSTPRSFIEFSNKYIPLTHKSYQSVNELTELSEKEAVFIAGSDQIWNPRLSNIPDIYFLNFVKEGKKIAYSASLGKVNIEDECRRLLLKYLPSFDSISIREKEGATLVSNLVQVSCKWVTDPVFLLSKDEWKKMLMPRPIKEDYILVYRMEDNPLFQEKVDELKEIHPSLKVLVFDYITKGVTYDVFVNVKGPREFITYIYYSKYIVTNSFHGTAFSVIFNKTATIIPHTTLNNRISSLMSLIDVESNNGVYTLPSKNIRNLEIAIQDSMDYLHQAI